MLRRRPVALPRPLVQRRQPADPPDLTMTANPDDSAPTGVDGFDLVIRGTRLLTAAGIVAGEIGIRDGTIARIEPLGSGLDGVRTIELTADETLIPGLVDTHVHVN